MERFSQLCGYSIRMTSVSSGIFDYDVALSYAGEDRAYVEQVAAQLRQRDVRIFYDEYAAAQLWGNDLYVLLDEVYRKRARFTVIFVSRYYASKPWTQHERQSAQARALTNIGPYLLPVRLDDSELPGLRPTVGYIDARNTSVERLVWLIEQKLAATPGMATSQPLLLRSPRTAEQKRELLRNAPTLGNICSMRVCSGKDAKPSNGNGGIMNSAMPVALDSTLRTEQSSRS
jgi:hypothetical protein